MNLIPDWAPGIHPMVVHFPVALLSVAVLADLAGLIWRNRRHLQILTVTLYLIGAATIVAAYFSGEWGLENIVPPARAERAISSHADIAKWTAWFFVVFAIARLVVFRVGAIRNTWIKVLLVVGGITGFVLLFTTAERGARLVFDFGVGVEAVAEQAQIRAEIAPPGQSLVSFEDGWKLQPVLPSDWKGVAEWLVGDPASIQTSIVSVDTSKSAIQIEAGGPPALFVFKPELDDIEAELLFDADDFDGRFALVHSLHDRFNYFFVEWDGERISQGRVVDGERELLDSAKREYTGTSLMRLVADGTHYRAYDGGGLVAHGHSIVAEKGRAGLFLEGTGNLKVILMMARTLE